MGQCGYNGVWQGTNVSVGGSRVQMGGDYHFASTLAYWTPLMLPPRMEFCTLYTNCSRFRLNSSAASVEQVSLSQVIWIGR